MDEDRDGRWGKAESYSTKWQSCIVAIIASASRRCPADPRSNQAVSTGLIGRSLSSDILVFGKVERFPWKSLETDRSSLYSSDIYDCLTQKIFYVMLSGIQLGLLALLEGSSDFVWLLQVVRLGAWKLWAWGFGGGAGRWWVGRGSGAAGRYFLFIIYSSSGVGKGLRP